MGVSSTQVGDHWGSARTVQPSNQFFPSEKLDLAAVLVYFLHPRPGSPPLLPPPTYLSSQIYIQHHTRTGTTPSTLGFVQLILRQRTQDKQPTQDKQNKPVHFKKSTSKKVDLAATAYLANFL